MKRILKVLAVLLLVLVLIGVGVGLFADRAAAKAIERGGGYALGVPTKVESADVGFFSQSFGLSGLSVDNPEGFDDEEHFLSLSDAGIEVDVGTLMSDSIHVPELRITGLALAIERTSKGTNYGKILEHLERFESGEAPPPEEPAEPGPRIVIDRVVVRDLVATVDLTDLGGEATDLPPIRLSELIVKDVDTGAKGQTVARLFAELLPRILEAILKEGAGILPEDILADLGGRLESLSEVAVQEGKEAASEAIEGAKEEIGEKTKQAAEKLEKGIGGLLDGKKDEQQ